MYTNLSIILRPKEVCQRLGILRTLQEYVKKGIITPIKLPSGKTRFKEEVEKLEGIISTKFNETQTANEVTSFYLIILPILIFVTFKVNIIILRLY